MENCISLCEGELEFVRGKEEKNIKEVTDVKCHTGRGEEFISVQIDFLSFHFG